MRIPSTHEEASVPTQLFTANGQMINQFLGAPARGFLIPVYQRDYSWGRDDVDRLFEDLSTAATDIVEDHNDLVFLGSVIVTGGQVPEGSEEPTALFHLVDGQQRVTTLLLAAAGMRHALVQLHRQMHDENEIKSVCIQVANQLRKICIIDMDRGPEQFWPRLIRTEDRWAYRSDRTRYRSGISRLIAREVLGDSSLTPSDDTMLAQAWRRVGELVEEYSEGGDEPVLSDLAGAWDQTQALQDWVPQRPESASELRGLRLALLGRSLLERVQVIVVEAPDEDRAFSIFEPLNTTGQLLTAIETIKPHLVQLEGGPNAYLGSESEQHVSHVEEVVSDKDPMRKAKNSADLVTVFALAESGKKLGHRLVDQRRELGRLVKEAELAEARRVLSTMSDVATFVEEIWNARGLGTLAQLGHDIPWVSMAFIRDSNHAITRGLFTRYYRAFRDELISEPDWKRLISTTAAFWFLWRASRSTTGGIDSHYRTLMKVGWPAPGSRERSVCGPLCHSASHGRKLPPVSDVVAAFRHILRTKGGIDGPKTWISQTTGIGVYGGKSIEKFGLLLAHHDAVISQEQPYLQDGNENCSPLIARSVWEGLGLTTEHIAPRTRGRQDESYDDAIYAEKRLIDGWGNLTLVPQAENSKLSNRPWSEKRDFYRVLGERDPVTRTQLLEEWEWDVSPKTLDTLRTAKRLTFCTALGKYDEDQWAKTMVEERGRVLAQRMWNRAAEILDLSLVPPPA